MNPYTPEQPRKSWPRRHKILTGMGLAVALIVVFGVVGAVAANQPKHVTTASAQRTTAPAAPAASSAPAPAPVPSPNGTYNTSCDDSIGAGIYDPNYLTGEVDITNTGNVGLVLRVKFHWKQEAYPDITAVKTVRVRDGASKVARFHAYAGTFAGSTAPLDRWQSWQDDHNGNPCTSHVTEVTTFGPVQ